MSVGDLPSPFTGAVEETGAGSATGCEITRSRISRKTLSTSSSIMLGPHQLGRRFGAAIVRGFDYSRTCGYAGIQIRYAFEMVHAGDPQEQGPVKPVIALPRGAMDGQ